MTEVEAKFIAAREKLNNLRQKREKLLGEIEREIAGAFDECYLAYDRYWEELQSEKSKRDEVGFADEGAQ